MPDLEKFKWYLENVLKQSPEVWNRVIELMEASRLEIREVQKYDPVAATAAPIAVRSLILLGELSPAFIQDSVTLLRPCLTNSDVVVLPGQGHTAQANDPHLIADPLASFFGN